MVSIANKTSPKILSFNSDETIAHLSEIMPSFNTREATSSDLILDYYFPGVALSQKTENGTIYHTIKIPACGFSQEFGKPNVPVKTSLIAIPEGRNISVTLIDSQYQEFPGYYLYPAQLRINAPGVPQNKFNIDRVTYSQNTYYPAEILPNPTVQTMKGQKLGILKVFPVQFNPAQKTIRIYSKITIRVDFVDSGSSARLSNASASNQISIRANHFLKQYVVNPNQVAKDSATNTPTFYGNSNGFIPIDPDYIIITTDRFLEAAQKLAKWKGQLGYRVEIVNKPTWTYEAVNTTVHSRYKRYNPVPDYLTIIGDYEDIPGKLGSFSHSTMTWEHSTDHFFVCMDGEDDYLEDMAKGRISVSTPAEANVVVDKIINYEKNPVTDPDFYKSALHSTYFETNSLYGGDPKLAVTHEAQSTEELLRYMTDQHSFKVDRVYYAEDRDTPTYWWEKIPIPAYLLQPGFAWKGNAADITTSIEKGVLYALHSGHGDPYFWVDPRFTTENVFALKNQNKLPVIFNNNCLTGQYLKDVCMAEAFLRNPHGGAVGFFGYANVSFMDYSDAVLYGCLDGLFNNPGISPSWTSNDVSTHVEIGQVTTMGDLRNHAMFRMMEYFSEEEFLRETFMYFGDPAMRMWTKLPSNITTSFDSQVPVGSRKISVKVSNLDGALATILYKGKLIGKAVTSKGTNTPISLLQAIDDPSGEILLTISKQDYKPIVAKLTVTTATAPVAIISYSPLNAVAPATITLDGSKSYNPTGSPMSYQWQISNGHTANTNTTQVAFSTAGTYNATLTVTANGESNSQTVQIPILAALPNPRPSPSPYPLPPNALQVQYTCNETAASTNQIKMTIAILNQTKLPVPFELVTFRYYYTCEGGNFAAQEFHIDDTSVNYMTASFHDGYVEFGFKPSETMLEGFSGYIQLRINKKDWSNYNQSDDYSFNHSVNGINDKMTSHYQSKLNWGNPPSGVNVTSASSRNR